MQRFLLVPAAVLAAVLIIFANVRPAAVSAGNNQQTLTQLDAELMKAGAERGTAGYMSYYAENAVELMEGFPAIQGREAISKSMSFLDDKRYRLTWTPVYEDMSASGDLGYIYGTYVLQSTGKDGKPAFSSGKYTTVWKKQPDGTWKVVLDMGNSNAAPKG